MLGTASDTEIAARLDRHIASVCIRRQELGIGNFYWQQRCGRQRNLEAKPRQDAGATIHQSNHPSIPQSSLTPLGRS
jgi:hypothetical protein